MIQCANQALTDKEIQNVQRDMCRFIMHEVIHKNGRFFDRGGELASHPRLCVWDSDS
jgi:hypothetical protein